MRSRLLALLFVILATGLPLLPAPRTAHGCAVAPRRGEYVDVASESAVIVWDAKTKTEHFIRAASFTTSSADFGFLVPTPTQPELAEAPQTLFNTFEAQTAPRIEYRTNVQTIDPPGGCGDGILPTANAPAPKGAAMPDGVQVLGRARVGKYDAVSLKADDAAELLKWLDKNGYDARDELKSWLQWYTDNRWVLTAFKIASDPDSRRASATAVRMSFKTERPFYPYREPADQRNRASGPYPSRLLRVFFVSEGRFGGTVGDSGNWPADTAWSKEITPPAIEGVKLSPETKWTLTEFEDKSSPRPGTDEVYFAKSADQSSVERPPVVVWNTQYKYRERSWTGTLVAAVVAVPVLLLIAGLLLWRLLRRR